MKTIKPGDMVTVNWDRDLAMMDEARPFLGRIVEVLRVTKGGLYEVRLPLCGLVLSLPKYNLDPIPELILENRKTQAP